ncbi:hypothetical protein E4U21_002510 [Claviceps maximensis]|nr:hypothetical protein E4U21_002510 [Claviceps maximensis]
MTQMPPLQRASGTDFNGDGYIMGPRINLPRDVTTPQNPSARTVWNVLRRGEKNCHSGSDYDTCEKGINTNITNLAIILGVVNIKRLKQEDAQDPHKGLDFGMGDSSGKGGKRKSLFGLGGEKPSHRNNQLSMDMNLSSPYLLPPNVHESKDSLARTFPSDQDPYRTVKQYANSDAGSIRSYKPGQDASLYRGKTPGSMMSSRTGSQRAPPTRSDSKLKHSSSDAKSNPFATPTSPQATHQYSPTGDVQEPVRNIEPTIPEIGAVSFSDETSAALDVPQIRPPPRVMSQESHYGAPTSPFGDDKSTDEDHLAIAHADAGRSFSPAYEGRADGPGSEMDVPKIYSPDEYGAAGGDPGHPLSHDDYGHLPTQPYGRQEQQQFQEGLGVPQQQMKRLSVGFRPLPPDEVMESEDPEYRANRIRSFYKEYFDDGKEAPPPMPQHAPEYYENYESSYMGDAAYYDAENNAFVMPYAQPVTRRAMTPPPAGRFGGGPGGPGPRGPPRGGPRGPGSVGGMSLPGGPRGRPRAGSAAAYGPRPGSSASMGPRGRPVKKNLPPPVALPTLPTPSKLQDDSFAIFNAADFAPPDSIRDQASGRSQSPLGERRQYLPKVPIASPLVTAFDELSALPSPHVLRKSSTFTNLDFAPPKKFKDADTTSDAGSIRSNTSGISAAQLDALRRGAGRVSRLPGDTVFTSAALGDTLKPSWDMRT